MPRIDPQQLLKCLSVLLRPDGGIRSESEVQRLASLMTKFSKKLVSKCIYVQILKCSETKLLGLFMSSGGWTLTHMWLTDGILSKNWALVQELLELLLLCPVNVELLKTNNCPKLVKGLSKDERHEGVRLLAGKLVEQWLRLVKGETHQSPVHTSEPVQVEDAAVPVQIQPAEDVVVPVQKEEVSESLENSTPLPTILNGENITEPKVPIVPSDPLEIDNGEIVIVNKASEVSTNDAMQDLPVYKIMLKDGKQVLAKIESADKLIVKDKDLDKENEEKGNDKEKEKRDRERRSTSSKSSSSHRSSYKKHSSSKRSSSSSHRSSSKSSSRDKEKDKEKEREKERKSSVVKSSRDKDRDKDKDKANQTEKDKATLDKLKPPTLDKLMKIPKKARTDENKSPKSESKKPSMSIEVRKLSNGETSRPKTVKTFNSKFRSHGLEEEAKPPPSRSTTKKPAPVSVPLPSVKRSSPLRYEPVPPEKKAKIIADAASVTPTVQKQGAIKLIAAKPKPPVLMESDMFMDALTSATTKKDNNKKRKRKLSTSKDSGGEKTPPGSPTTTSSSSSSDVPNTPTGTGPSNIVDGETTPTRRTTVSDAESPEPYEEAKPVAPPRFYQDTLETMDEEKDKDNDETSDVNDKVTDEVEDDIVSKMEAEVKMEVEKSAEEKASIKITEESAEENAPTTEEKPVKTEEESKEVIDPNALKGVLIYTKRKGPKKKLQWKNEKELVDIQYFELDETERVNVTKTFTDMKQIERCHEREAFQAARKLPNNDNMEEKTRWMMLIPVDDVTPIQFGKSSREKDVQYAREKVVAQALYFNRSMIPDSPAEPDVEVHSITDPVVIPLEDVTGNPDTVNDFQNTPWPEPKGSPPPVVPVNPGLAMFPPFPPAPGTFPIPGPFGPGFPPGIPGMPGMPDWHGIPTPDMMNMPPSEMFNPMVMFPPNAMPPDPNFNPAMMDGGDMNGMFPAPFPPFNPGFPVNPAVGPVGVGGGNTGGGGGGGGGARSQRGTRNNRGMPNGGWNRGRGGGGGGNWNNSQRGGGGGGKWNAPRGVCHQFQSKGYCRQGDKCPYMHPGVNCPPY